MKRIVTGSVMGVFLLAAPLAYALDKAPTDSTNKEPVKTEGAPAVKTPEGMKSVTPTTKPDTVKSPAVQEEKAQPQKPVVEEKGAPMGVKSEKAVKTPEVGGKHKPAKSRKPAKAHKLEKPLESDKQQSM